MWKNGIVIVAVASLFSGSSYAACFPVKGKIVNNLHTPVDFHTMGVASVVFGDVKPIPLKCALLGQPVPPPNPEDPTSVAFVHTISCDDAIATLQGPIHSKLQFNTVGTVNLATGSFTETSTPIPGTGTGQFLNVNNQGSLIITGQIYPTGAIDMKVSGQACFN
jgi:hypothetical protein